MLQDTSAARTDEHALICAGGTRLPGSLVGRVSVGSMNRQEIVSKLRSQGVIIDTVAQAMLAQAPIPRVRDMFLHVVYPEMLNLHRSNVTGAEILTAACRAGFRLLSMHDVFVIRARWRSAWVPARVRAGCVPGMSHGLAFTQRGPVSGLESYWWDPARESVHTDPWMFGSVS